MDPVADSARHSVGVLRRLTLPQRVVLVVALGLALLADMALVVLRHAAR